MGYSRGVAETRAYSVPGVHCEHCRAALTAEVGAVPSPMTPEQFIAFIAAERSKWQEVVQTAGVQAQ